MALWRGTSPLILASQSSARKMLLANAGLEFKAITADIDERGIQAASKLSNPREIGLLLAREKAKAVSINHPGSYVIGADQTLALGGRLRTLAPIAVRSHRNARTSSDSGFAAAQR
jgi:septum formation protein